ncbi:MAG TPA: ATPase domain-containing protein, partial [Candidatus Woesebacteria bacterium]|nr:ATPase domain-containing protein [Candidatus Woesebacteria bacterium]
MAKTSTQFVCNKCGYSTPQWFGKCPSCGEWNSLVEFRDSTRFKSAKFKGQNEGREAVKLDDIKMTQKNRISTGIEEFDRVVGNGLVPGSVVLLAGEPGIGKSTLLLQLANALTTNHQSPITILYISGEESVEQIKLRADRLGIKADKLFIQNETNVEKILEEIETVSEIKEEGSKSGLVSRVLPSLLIIDSVQTLWSENQEGIAGSIGQVKESTAKLINLVKSRNIPLILVGQVTKEGAIAGPMTLAHMVDTVLFLEGERFQSLRLL